jgi:hypothetical protein
MDGPHFDALTRSLALAGSRRRALAAALAASLSSHLEVAQAKKGGGKKKGGGGKQNKKNDNKKNERDKLDCTRPRILCPTPDGPACVDLRKHPLHCGQCGVACPKDPVIETRDFECQGGNCVCTGVVCPNGRCCPADYASCIGNGEGCCPTNYYGCPNAQPVDCCPNGYTCGGNCGQPCCSPRP